MFDHPEFDDHEHVAMVSDPATGLKAVIALHSTRLGPAIGGARYWTYDGAEAAVRDALNLSRGMTYKNALAGLPHGGGKSTLIGDPRAPKPPGRLKAFGEALNRLNGLYYTAEDSGISVADIDEMRAVTPYVLGGSTGPNAGGDPSPFTAEGVFLGLKAAVAARYGTAELKDLRIGVLGLGAVGGRLAEKLAAAGATLIAADLSAERTSWAAETLGARIVAPMALPFEAMEVFAPCALGGAVDAAFLDKGVAQVVAGAANNQLAEPSFDAALWETGRVYAPDYLVNAGGVMNVAAELAPTYDAAAVWAKVAKLGETTAEVLAEAKRRDRPTGAIADEKARAIIAAGPP